MNCANFIIIFLQNSEYVKCQIFPPSICCLIAGSLHNVLFWEKMSLQVLTVNAKLVIFLRKFLFPPEIDNMNPMGAEIPGTPLFVLINKFCNELYIIFA